MLKKLEQAVSTWMFKLIMPIMGALLIGLLTIVLNQADNRVAAAEQTIVKTNELLDKHCSSSAKILDEKLSTKVDNRHFDSLMNIIRDEQKEQKILNKELIETMNEIKIHILKE